MPPHLPPSTSHLPPPRREIPPRPFSGGRGGSRTPLVAEGYPVRRRRSGWAPAPSVQWTDHCRCRSCERLRTRPATPRTAQWIELPLCIPSDGVPREGSIRDLRPSRECRMNTHPGCGQHNGDFPDFGVRGSHLNRNGVHHRGTRGTGKNSKAVPCVPCAPVVKSSSQSTERNQLTSAASAASRTGRADRTARRAIQKEPL